MLQVEKYKGCLIGGAIGDAWGSAWEFAAKEAENTWYWDKKPEPAHPWMLTDDTQLTLATCEILGMHTKIEPAVLAAHFLLYYKQGKLTGLGASTLKALQDLDAGIAWQYAGRTGEYAAGNGAAMRIAPLAFYDIDRDTIRDVCRITHRNDEAYAGALAVVLAIRAALDGTWTGGRSLIGHLLHQLPDTRVRDRLIDIDRFDSIAAAATLGCDGYVVNSVPLAIFAASRMMTLEEMYQQLINTRGDTDTMSSIAGQIAGALIGASAIPVRLSDKLKTLPGYEWLVRVINFV
jgi:ADP-ribosylglycohydrolase